MNVTIILIITGAIIGTFIGYNKYKYGNQTFHRKPNRDFPNLWRTILEERIEFYNKLDQAGKRNFETKVHIFLLNVQIVGVDTEVTHVDRVLVAASAVIPIFGFPNWHYVHLKEVQIHPDIFLIPGTTKMAKGLVGKGAMEGKMMLSRKAVEKGFYDQTDQVNVALHEFIHILDKQDGEIDGVLDNVMNEADIMPWLHIIHQKMGEIEAGNSTIRDYGAANRAEFLSVVGEFFFESPEKMKAEHPALYSALDSIFNPKKVSPKRKRRDRVEGW
jgi:Mlc titration factor MtfA (ptsG expression regulator)